MVFALLKNAAKFIRRGARFESVGANENKKKKIPFPGAIGPPAEASARAVDIKAKGETFVKGLCLILLKGKPQSFPRAKGEL